MGNLETSQKSSERHKSVESTGDASEHRESPRESLEKAEAKHKAERATTEAVKLAEREATEKAQNMKGTQHSSEHSPAKKRGHLITKSQRDASFAREMDHIQSEMKPSERKFSKFIHDRTVEHISDGLGATIARPNALLAGSVAAFLAVTILYMTAKHYGYQLSGFETIGAFAVGWALGLIYDYFRVLITGKR